MLTLSLIERADPDAVLKFLQDCKTSAADLVTTAEGYQLKVRSPGGQSWTGRTADAAQQMAAGDCAAIDALRAAADTMVDNATSSITGTAIPKLADLRRLIAEARADGMTVNEDLSLTFTNVCASQTAQAEAERKALQLQAAARDWWFADCSVATQIAEDANGLSVNLKVIGDPNLNLGSAAVTLSAGTMGRLGLELRKAAAGPGQHIPRNQLRDMLFWRQTGQHAVDKPPRRAHVKVPANAAQMTRVGRVLGPIGVIAGAGVETYSNIQAAKNGEMSYAEASGKTVGALGGGALGGMATGALVGSAFGPVGTAVGAGIGAVIGSEVGGRVGKWVGGLFS